MATISTPEYLIDQAKRRFTPSINNFPGMGALERRLLRTEFKQRALAAAARWQRPQAGDGRRGAADPRPHGRDVPRRTRLPDAPLQHEGPAVLRRLPRAARGDGAGPRRRTDHLLQPQQGLLAAGLDPGDRAVLPPRAHAARLRGAHVPPADHAGGVRPHPPGRLHRAGRPGGVEGDRQRLGRQRPAVPALSGDEADDPRHRLDGVHGPRAGHRPRAGDQGQQRLHHHGPRGQRDHPHRRAAVHVVARPAGPQAARELLRGAGRGNVAARRAPTCCRCCARPRTRTATSSPTPTSSTT